MIKTALTAAAAALALAAAPPARAQAGDGPRGFVRHALEGDNSEIVLGRLASHAAADRAVRGFGLVLEGDHSRARAEMERLARRLGETVGHDEMTPEARDERSRLQGLRGRDFDREFVRYMVRDHEKDVSEFRDQARGRGSVARLAARQLPVLEKHLHMARRLQTRLGA